MTSLALAFNVLATDNASKTLDKVGDSAERTGKKGRGMGPAFKAGLATAAVAVGAFAKGSISAFVEAEQSSARLDAALAKFPKTADVSRASFDKLNAALAKKTVFDDDATASGQAVLAQFHLTGKQIQNLTPLLQDYAAKTGKDLPTAAQDLGKAVLGQGKALKSVGLNLKDTGSAAGNVDQLMAGLRKQVGGFAEKEGKTAGGQAEILRNQFGEVQEEVGGKLVPVLTDLAGWLLKTIDFVQRNANVIGPLVAVLGTMVLTTVAINKAMAIGMAVKTAWLALTGAQTGATVAATGAQTGLNAALIANPIGLVIVAIAGLAAGLIYAYKHSETFRNIVQTTFKVISSAASFMWNSVLKPIFRLWLNTWFTVIGALVNGAASAFGWVPGIGDKLKAAAKKFNTFRDEVNRSLDGIKDKDINVNLRLAAGGAGTVIQGRGGKMLVDAAPASAGTAGGLRLAGGGFVSGPGTSTSDSIRAALSSGEFVVNAAATRQHRSTLEAINSGQAMSRPPAVINVTMPVARATEDNPQTVARSLRRVAWVNGW